jgi:hypothetical protein
VLSGRGLKDEAVEGDENKELKVEAGEINKEGVIYMSTPNKLVWNKTLQS